MAPGCLIILVVSVIVVSGHAGFPLPGGGNGLSLVGYQIIQILFAIGLAPLGPRPLSVLFLGPISP
ncbi:hypothetical protein F5884DRAFT_811477 [Xylogone sp. PMI_703]|nr:hypothetical protein F5884DRAFT_811477 [Xylogone sp. PMI_703]